MLPWIELAAVKVPGEKADLRLLQRGDEFSIMIGTNPLMGSRRSTSEEQLATLAAARIGDRRPARMLIGGLGMGFTLRAALGALAGDAQITVVELIPAIVAWARGPLLPVFGTCLDDPRVSVVEADVRRVIGTAKATYDAILLDVDNGPEALTQAANDGLYDHAGLAAARNALRPGGVLAVWSAHPSPPFAKRLGQAGFAVEEVHTRANGRRGARHVIWLATKRP